MKENAISKALSEIHYAVDNMPIGKMLDALHTDLVDLVTIIEMREKKEKKCPSPVGA